MALLLLDDAVLQKSFELKKNNPVVIKALEELKEQSEFHLKQGLYSVVMKNSTPPSRDMHDFMALSRYWWPNPDTDDGLPYVLRDGETNPETKGLDRLTFEYFYQAVIHLTMGYYFFHDSLYGERAALLLRFWYLEAATRMNPHLQFAGFIPGICEGRGNGIISSLKMTRLLDMIEILHRFGKIDANEYQGYRRWFREYRDWLKESEFGREESLAANNHGTWYDTQLIAYSLFIGDTEFVTDYLKNVSIPRLFSQISSDGSQAQELGRTKSLFYSEYNLNAWIDLSSLAEKAGIDLWQLEDAGDERPVIRKMIDWLLPFLTGERTWTYMQIDEYDINKFIPHLYRLARKYPDANYTSFACELKGIRPPSGITLLMHRCF